ncbi:hypothetical protein [Herbaspirillum sp. 1130]|uniref:hypothetical protein n=1 Tax=Herbaspirillum sp. 1130 TaxID=2806562 RepID=UPI001AE91410|nr:hypothetical protein [Herbaspirillum sp. 1130]MBP1316323.1 hypothetical protein [Herbaspirillum sp. 1130]
MTRFHLAPESEARFRAITHKTLHVSHVRHKCACGKQTTAKALTQYGHCVICQKTVAKRAAKIPFGTGPCDRSVPVFPSAWTKARNA